MSDTVVDISRDAEPLFINPALSLFFASTLCVQRPLLELLHVRSPTRDGVSKGRRAHDPRRVAYQILCQSRRLREDQADDQDAQDGGPGTDQGPCAISATPHRVERDGDREHYGGNGRGKGEREHGQNQGPGQSKVRAPSAQRQRQGHDRRKDSGQDHGRGLPVLPNAASHGHSHQKCADCQCNRRIDRYGVFPRDSAELSVHRSVNGSPVYGCASIFPQ